MQDFTITTRLTIKEYTKVMYTGLYKKPVYILATVAGLYWLIAGAIFYSSVLEISLGVILLLMPSLIVLLGVKQVKANKDFINGITHIIGESGIIAQGEDCNSSYTWAQIIKHKEIGNFLILNFTRHAGYFIDKAKLTEEQLKFIKAKVQ